MRFYSQWYIDIWSNSSVSQNKNKNSHANGLISSLSASTTQGEAILDAAVSRGCQGVTNVTNQPCGSLVPGSSIRSTAGLPIEWERQVSVCHQTVVACIQKRCLAIASFPECIGLAWDIRLCYPKLRWW